MVTAIYQISDLFPGFDGVKGYYHYYHTAFAVEDCSPRGWKVRAWGEVNNWCVDCAVHTIFDHEPTAAEVRTALYAAYKHELTHREPEWQPITPAEPVAMRFKTRIRLTPAELLADPVFVRLARKAAEAGKQFTSELLEWERKDTVREAVAVLAAQVEADRAHAAQVVAAERARLDAIRAEQAPVRTAVSEGYEACGYRECTQGHSYEVVIGPKTGCAAEIRTGSRYSSRVTFRRRFSHHTLFVRPEYLTRVFQIGGARCGGMLVLDAKCAGACDDGTPVFELKCVKQSAGTNIESTTVTAVAEPVGSLGAIRWIATKKLPYTKMPAAIVPDYVQDKTGCDDDAVADLRAACATV